VKELVTISGKGGTGKTSVVAALATLAKEKLLVDCDVDAANLHLLLEPQIKQRESFSGGKQAQIDPDRCSACGQCGELCRYGAIRNSEEIWSVDPLACEGCGVCAWFCPADAIRFESVINGEWFTSDTRHGTLIHARLQAGGENSGRLVTLLRQRARELAELLGLELIIADGSPGVGCQVIASLSGADLALVVSEPTLSGIHDFGRIADLAAHFTVPAVLCINKWDINPKMTTRLEEEAERRGIQVVGRVRYDSAFTRAQRRGLSLIECDGEPAAEDLKGLWKNIQLLVVDGETTLKTV
jgi:MinD superfamily P-loop ATPase